MSAENFKTILMESAQPALPQPSLQDDLGRAKEGKTSAMIEILCPNQKIEGEVGEVPTDYVDQRKLHRVGVIQTRVKEAIEFVSINKGRPLAAGTLGTLSGNFASDILRDIWEDLDSVPDKDMITKLTKLFRVLIEEANEAYRKDVIRQEIANKIASKKAKNGSKGSKANK